MSTATIIATLKPYSAATLKFSSPPLTIPLMTYWSSEWSRKNVYRIASQRGLFNFGTMKEEIYPVIVGYMEDLRTARKRGVKDALVILYQMICTRCFVRSMVTMLKLLVANFMRANEDVQIEGQALSSLVASEGFSVDGYIAAKVMAKRIPPSALTFSVLPVLLRTQVEIVLAQYIPVTYTKRTLYPSELPGFKLLLNDSLNFHDTCISLITEGSDKYQILYNMAKLPREIEATAILTDSIYVQVLVTQRTG